MMNMQTRIDRDLAPQGRASRRYLAVRLVAPSRRPDQPRPSLSVAFVVDRSGSMAGGKLRRAVRAVRHAMAHLQPCDRVALVSYASECSVDLPLAAATADHIRAGLSALGELVAGGQTALHDGWLRGCEQVAAAQESADMTRVLLLTDGQANVGECDHDLLRERAAGLRKRGVCTTTFGLGLNFEETLLEGMARHGGGAFYYIENANQVAAFMARELDERLRTTARDARLVFDAPAGVEVVPLPGFAVERYGRQVHVLVGDLCADQVIDTMVEVRLPAASAGAQIALRVDAVADGARLQGGLQIARWVAASAAECAAQRRDEDVAYQLAELLAADARQRALQCNRRRRYRRAQAILNEAAERIGGSAGDGPRVLAVIDKLDDEADRYGKQMTEADRKMAYFDAATHTSSRNTDGSSRIVAGRRLPGS